MRMKGNLQRISEFAAETVRPGSGVMSLRWKKIDQIAQDIRETGI